MIDGLYYLDNNSFSNKKGWHFSSISSIAIHEQIMLWHLRLGHPSFLYLKYLFLELFKNLSCLPFQSESCHFSKSYHAKYPSKPIVL
jgi:hypothetical protein